MKSLKLASGVVAMLTAAGLAAGASAQSVTEVRAATADERTTVTVSVDDLDLASAAGQEVLLYRLSAAAKQACGSSNVRVAGGVARAARNAECQEAALSRALARVNRGAVATITR